MTGGAVSSSSAVATFSPSPSTRYEYVPDRETGSVTPGIFLGGTGQEGGKYYVLPQTGEAPKR
jgi:hypothetical protein